jgi:enoyl-CoA hydratase/carnithine racemase
VIDLDRQGNVFVLQMRGGENRFTSAFLDAFEAALEQIEKTSGPAALVTTGEGKFYSNGLDMPTLAAAGKAGREGVAAVLGRVHRLFARVLAFPRITVAAMNGHAFAGGRKQVAHEAIVTGRRYAAGDALARGMVDEVADEAEVLPRAIALAAELAEKEPTTMAALKRGLHGAALRLLEGPEGLGPELR